ncbi:MAG TPA: ACP synthase [Cyanobacteria bacterium UBA11162]|nr:ACP synthase [Cyanobacteria bacterium UBA11162]
MGIKAIGIDIAPISNITRLVKPCDRQTLTLLFTPGEIDRCESDSNPYQSYAICFATKEAVGKALRTGLVGIDWTEIEAKLIQNQLIIHLHGKAKIQAKKRGVQEWLATWWCWDNHVFVHVIAH